MAERRSARLLTQRQLEVEPPAPALPEPPVPPPEAAPSAPPAPPPDRPIPPSNESLLERQRRWLRERSRFEASRSAEESER